MNREIKIKKRGLRRGEDGHRIISVRMRDDILKQLDELSALTNRSRNELINRLLKSALKDVTVEEADEDDF
ncbi:MAG: ribbon-helix-helix protein, CopG family [Clostridia bacterium]|nr:ribbon-helix-helix protein, CopG family [Clostridia bacterium]